MARKMAHKINIDFAFFTYLLQFYQQKRRHIRSQYKDLTKKYLDFNSPGQAHSYLRLPQYEALEMYVFIKEFLYNAPVHQIFKDWNTKERAFTDRSEITIGAGGQLDFFKKFTKEQYETIFERMRSNIRSYSNYIFALTMGTGKTILMATCIYYEFILANKFPKDERFCHNAVVFAPDKTVLQSLRELQSFNMKKVVPPEYVNFLAAHIQFHFLQEAGSTLNVLDKSRFNIIVSNTQKIILKRQNKEKSPMEKLLGSGKPTYETDTIYEKNVDLYGFDQPDDEESLSTNQRFEKLRRLEQLGIYVDEAHHAFGSQLEKDMGLRKTKTSLRLTIDELAASLERAGTHVVACYNYTGTPYVGQEILPEVVYAYGLQEAINKGYLKKVRINGYTNPKSTEFIQIVIEDFVKNYGNKRHENMLPKIAFFAATIEELKKELRPAVEEALHKQGISTEKILVNVGDEKITTNDEIREFIHLDSPASEKQFILLVNKGREGWNCRSLFSVALFRKPHSKIFVLQATMRCLRSIGEGQQTANVFLSEENRQILNDELQQNFRISVDDMQEAGREKQDYQVRLVPPPVKIKLKRVHRQYTMKEKDIQPGIGFEFEQVDTEKYRLLHTQQEGLKPGADHSGQVVTEDLTFKRERRIFTEITLVAEISRYLNKPCLLIEEILGSTQEGFSKILEWVNEYNELLYDCVIPHLFHALYEIEPKETHEDYEVELVHKPDKGFYEISAKPDLVVSIKDVEEPYKKKSFHLDTYCFDSDPERNLFWCLLKEGKINKLYFTGMLTHGQTDFFVQYIDPESHTVRSYYPDFLIQNEDGSYTIIEVKADNQIEDPIVQAKKEFTESMAVASGMRYEIIKSSDAGRGNYRNL